MTVDRRVVPFRRWHYAWLADGFRAAEGGDFRLSPGALASLEGENSWTGLIEGEVMVCAGTIAQWPGRHTAWAYVARGTLRHMPWITAETKKALDAVKGRIEFTVRADFPAGLRWAKTLGFEVETPLLKNYGPEGESHVGFVRFN